MTSLRPLSWRPDTVTPPWTYPVRRLLAAGLGQTSRALSRLAQHLAVPVVPAVRRAPEVLEFYAESGYDLNHAQATAAFQAILADEGLGHVWLIQDGELAVGHVVVTYRFGMEYSGLIACIDDLYVMPAHRNKGLSTAALPTTAIRSARR